MPSGTNLDQILMPTFCFGDVSRDEINTVLNIAGVSLTPPKKTPFVTGIQRKKRVVLNTPIILQQRQQQQQQHQVTRSPSPLPRIRQFETVFVEPEEEEETPILTAPAPSAPVSVPAPVVTAPTPATPVEKKQPIEEKKEQPTANQQQQQQQKSTPKKEAAANKATPPPSATAPAQQAAPASPATTTTSTLAVATSNNKTPISPASSSTTTTASTTVEPPSPQPKIKPPVASWAALVKKNEPVVKKSAQAQASSSNVNGTAAPAMTNGKQQGQQKGKPATSPTLSVVPTSKFTGVADIISKYEPNYHAPLLQPRGLINNVNTCFMNVILQPLSHCAPFYNLVKTISNQTVQPMKSKTPLLDSIIEFINEFQSERLENLDPYGEPFVPEYVYNALRNQKKFDTLRGRQEDSEEFLCFLLDGLHEEMTAVLKEQQDKKDAEQAAAHAANGGAGNDWLEVGAKNKTSNLRQNTFDESPISKIFMGKLRSVLRCPGAKDSINQEPYQSLPLDIQPDNVHTIEDAIANMTLPEIMHDYTSPKGLKVEATKQVYLEGLPPVLILHMKRFVFDNVGGVQKLSKRVNYGAKLTIHPEWLAPAMRTSANAVTYELFGSVYHHGSSAGGGHYTCDIKRRTGEWLHIDDTTITSVSEQDVLVTEENTRTSEKLHAGQTAYILFYVRSS